MRQEGSSLSCFLCRHRTSCPKRRTCHQGVPAPRLRSCSPAVPSPDRDQISQDAGPQAATRPWQLGLWGPPPRLRAEITMPFACVRNPGSKLARGGTRSAPAQPCPSGLPRSPSEGLAAASAGRRGGARSRGRPGEGARRPRLRRQRRGGGAERSGGERRGAERCPGRSQPRPTPPPVSTAAPSPLCREGVPDNPPRPRHSRGCPGAGEAAGGSVCIPPPEHRPARSEVPGIYFPHQLTELPSAEASRSTPGIGGARDGAK